MAESVASGLRTVDEAADPYLSGRFAPVRQETDADDLLVEGTLPADLDGVFMRNGPKAWDAADFPRAPVAKVAIPATVPNGLHANWFPRLPA